MSNLCNEPVVPKERVAINKLLTAVILRAIDDLYHHEYRYKAERWIFNDAPAICDEHGVTLRYCCEHAEIDISRVRKTALRIIQENIKHDKSILPSNPTTRDVVWLWLMGENLNVLARALKIPQINQTTKSMFVQHCQRGGIPLLRRESQLRLKEMKKIFIAREWLTGQHKSKMSLCRKLHSLFPYGRTQITTLLKEGLKIMSEDGTPDRSQCRSGATLYF